MARRRSSGPSIDIEVSGDRQVELKLREIAARAASTKPAFTRMLRDLEEEERKWFATRGNYSWDAMDTGTRRRHGQHPLLELSGTLMKSLVQQHAKYSVRQSRDGELTFGTRDPVARIVAKRRPVLAPFARDRRRLSERLREHILAQE